MDKGWSRKGKMGFDFLFTSLILAVIVAGYAPAVVAKEPIKVGLVLPYTGPIVANAKQQTQGMELAFAQAGWKVAGREIKLIKEDDQFNPEVCLTKVRKLVERDKVHFLAGVHGGSVFVVRNYVNDHGIPLILGYTAAEASTNLFSKYIFYVGEAGAHDAPALGDYYYKKLGLRKAIGICADFPAGYTECASFKRGFENLGGKVLQEFYPPHICMDFSSYLLKIDVEKADCVFAFYDAGSVAVTLVKQCAEFGLTGRLTMGGVGIVDPVLLPEEGDAALGWHSSNQYCPVLDTPENKRFVQAYETKYGHKPSDFTEIGYVAGKVIMKALEAVNGKTDDMVGLAKAIENVRFEGPRGPFRFHENHSPIQNIYISKVEKVKGGLIHVILDTYRDVYQGWR